MRRAMATTSPRPRCSSRHLGRDYFAKNMGKPWAKLRKIDEKHGKNEGTDRNIQGKHGKNDENIRNTGENIGQFRENVGKLKEHMQKFEGKCWENIGDHRGN